MGVIMNRIEIQIEIPELFFFFSFFFFFLEYDGNLPRYAPSDSVSSLYPSCVLIRFFIPMPLPQDLVLGGAAGSWVGWEATNPLPWPGVEERARTLEHSRPNRICIHSWRWHGISHCLHQTSRRRLRSHWRYFKGRQYALHWCARECVND